MDLLSFSKLLHNREYRNEITENECYLAEELGFVVVFGYSDDVTVLKGAINSEFSSFNGREVFLDENGVIEECECNCKHYEDAIRDKKILKSIWGVNGYCWTFQIEGVEHYSFDILDEDEEYCKGIIFNIKSLIS